MACSLSGTSLLSAGPRSVSVRRLDLLLVLSGPAGGKSPDPPRDPASAASPPGLELSDKT